MKEIKTQIIKLGSNQNHKPSLKEETDLFPWFQQLHLTFFFCIQFASRLAAILKHNKPQNKYLFFVFSLGVEGFEIQTSRLVAQAGAVKSKVTKHFSLSLRDFFF